MYPLQAAIVSHANICSPTASQPPLASGEASTSGREQHWRRGFSSGSGEGGASSSSGDDDVSKIGNEKVQKLAGEVLGLTVLESSWLSSILRKKLDIPKPAFGGGAMPAFPMAAMGGAPAAGGAAAAPEAPAPEPAKEKSEFDVKLESFSPEGKIKVIKEIRVLTSLGLKEAKELVR